MIELVSGMSGGEREKYGCNRFRGFTNCVGHESRIRSLTRVKSHGSKFINISFQFTFSPL